MQDLVSWLAWWGRVQYREDWVWRCDDRGVGVKNGIQQVAETDAGITPHLHESATEETFGW